MEVEAVAVVLDIAALKVQSGTVAERSRKFACFAAPYKTRVTGL